MTTQEKITAIQRILANHQDNVTAAQNVQILPGLSAYVVEAMNTAFKDDLQLVFRLTRPMAVAGDH